MRKVIIISALLSVALLAGGCDFFRTIAGRPTSEEIAAKKARIEEYESQKALRDEVAEAQKNADDSLEVAELAKNPDFPVVKSKQLSEDSRASLSSRYYIIVGAFGQRDNAMKLASKANEAGFASELLTYRNGFIAVGLCPTDNLSEAYSSLKKIRAKSFCPKDAWILDTQ